MALEEEEAELDALLQALAEPEADAKNLWTSEEDPTGETTCSSTL